MSEPGPVRAPGHQALLDIASNPEWSAEFEGFLKHVLFQLDAATFATVLDECARCHPQADDFRAFYESLKAKCAQAKGGAISNLRDQLNALAEIKQTLTGQITQLSAPNIAIDGYAEIGYCGRLIKPLAKQSGMTLTGDIVVITDAERATDIIEAGFPKPSNKFVPMGDYDAIDETQLATESLDMVVCPIGLHHIPNEGEKMSNFIGSIARVIRSGGSFFLRDHDVPASDRKAHAMAQAAHSVFNAATGVCWEDEQNEVRIFRSADEWTRILARHGLERVGPTLFTAGDPSGNGMMRFIKQPRTGAERQALALETKMSNADYARPLSQTYLTTLEWHLVHNAEDQAELAREVAPHRWPLIQNLATLWRTFAGSMNEARRIDGVKSLSPSWTLISTFMVLTTSLEYVWRQAMLLPLYLLPDSASKNTSGAAAIATMQADYAAFIQHTPFYQFSVQKHVANLWKAVKADGWLKAPINAWLATVVSAELLAKAAVAAPLGWFYQDSQPEHMFILVHDPKHVVPASDAEDGRVQRKGDYAMVRTARYAAFRDKLLELTSAGLDICEVSGQERIQVKIKLPKGERASLQGIATTDILDTIPIHGQGGAFEYVRMDASISALKTLFAQVRACPGAEVTYIHDY